MSFPLLFERSAPGRRAYYLPDLDVPEVDIRTTLTSAVIREDIPGMPEVSEGEIVRHYLNLSHRNHSVDSGFYPLGSCTMKYNPKLNEEVAAFPGFTNLHPLQPVKCVQGTLELLYSLTEALCTITGMKWGTLQPYAGAHGEFTGMKLFKAWFESKGDESRKVILVPDSAHGTNPASAHIAGFQVVEIPSDERGLVSIEAIEPHLNSSLAGIMMTNPNTLGLFEQDIKLISDKVHEAGGLLYYDGANLNAVLGKCRPGDMGFDVVHVNLHKTFSTPHGGGGPGAGPVLVQENLIPFLPTPVVMKKDDSYCLEKGDERSIGRIAGFHGNVGVMVRAYAYIMSMGGDGLECVSEDAVTAANYLRKRLSSLLTLPYDRLCKHEFVLSANGLKETLGLSAMDIAKNLLDYGIHPPTVYFPLVVPEAIMVEPTETEAVEVLDSLVDAIDDIVRRAKEDPESVKNAPHKTPVTRVDEVRAARNPVLRWYPVESG
jgi:glycine dehydrogenase subunit 2